jgi:large subunit ribosomal protein L29
MKNSAIKDFSSVELVERVAEERQTLTRLRLGNALSAAENTAKIGQTKRFIARLLTEIRKRELNNLNAQS